MAPAAEATLRADTRQCATSGRCPQAGEGLRGHGWASPGGAAFLYAVDGVVTRRFDPLLYPEQQHGVPSSEEEEGLVLGWIEEADDKAASASTQPDPFRQAVQLVERLTGGTLTSEWLLSTTRPVCLMRADPAKGKRG